MYIRIVIVVVEVVLLIQGTACSPCFFWNTTLYHKGSCYKLFDSTNLSWSDAQTYCSSKWMAKLADSNSQAVDFLLQVVGKTNKAWWIGGSVTGGQCARLNDLNIFTNPTQDTTSCTIKQGFICQIFVGNPCLGEMPGGEYFNDGFCYQLRDEHLMYFDEANSTCARGKGRLAEFRLIDAYNYFKSKMDDTFNNMPIGGRVDIFLGGSDLMHEGVFTWFSTDTNVSINDWIPSEPNDWPDDNGEDHLCWRKEKYYNGYNKAFQLNDVNGTSQQGYPLCQKDVLKVNYLIVLLDSDVTGNRSPNIHVTSGNSEITYLHFTTRFNSGPETETDWVTSYHDVIHTLDRNIEMKDNDIYKGVVQLKSTAHVTVVLYQTSVTNVATTLVFPVQLFTSGYFVLTNASLGAGSQISVTAQQRETDVVIKLPRQPMQTTTISVNGFSFLSADKVIVRLNWLETAYVHSAEDLSGSFVYASKPVAVYSGSIRVQVGYQKSDNTLDMAVPVDSLSTEYITFPLSTSSSAERFRLLALYDNTDITVVGKEFHNVSISRAGYHSDINLSPGSFYFIKSDPYHPFYVIKISSSQQGACVTSLLPQTLWRSQYNVNVNAQETISLAMESQYVTNFRTSYNANCTAIIGTMYYGCTMTLSPGHYAIGLPTAGFRFVAYGSQSPEGIYCHALGTSDISGRTDNVSHIQTSFPGLRYINLREGEPFQPPNLPQTTTLPTTTQASTTSTSTKTTISNIGTTTECLETATTPERTITSEAVTKVENLTTTTEQALTSTKSDLQTSEFTPPTTLVTSTKLQNTNVPTTASEETTEKPAPSTTQVTPPPFPTTMPLFLPTTPEVAEASSINTTLLVCTSLCVPRINVSDLQLTSMTKKISKALFLNRRDTFVSRQKKQSTWDDRPSCRALGISGVVIMISWILFLSSPDIFRLFRYILWHENKVTIAEDKTT